MLSGVRVPPRLATLPLREKWVIAGSDVMIGYAAGRASAHDPWLDIIIYPAAQSAAAEGGGITQEIGAVWTGVARDAGVERAPAAPTGGASGWFHAALRNQPMTTGYVIVRRGNWFVEARGSAPDEIGEAGVRTLFAAVAAIDWERLRSRADAAFNRLSPPAAGAMPAAARR